MRKGRCLGKSSGTCARVGTWVAGCTKADVLFFSVPRFSVAPSQVPVQFGATWQGVASVWTGANEVTVQGDLFQLRRMLYASVRGATAVVLRVRTAVAVIGGAGRAWATRYRPVVRLPPPPPPPPGGGGLCEWLGPGVSMGLSRCPQG